MISYIKGTVIERGEEMVILENRGIGYEIKVPQPVCEQLQQREEVQLYTNLYVREDMVCLYGFLTKEMLSFFKQLITVNGIGPKAALAIFSVLSVDMLRFAILSEDVKTIAKAPGIGLKTAQKLILELKDKVGLQWDDSEEQQMPSEDMMEQSEKKQEAVQALVALGYSNTDAMKAVRMVQITDQMTIEEILKQALKNISF